MIQTPTPQAQFSLSTGSGRRVVGTLAVGLALVLGTGVVHAEPKIDASLKSASA